MRHILTCILAASVFPLTAQKPAPLALETIMLGPGFTGYEPSQVRFSGDSNAIYFEWKQTTDAVLAPMATWVVNRDGTGLRKLTDEESRMAPPAAAEVSKDRARRTWAREGDLYVYESATGETRRLTRTSEVESGPQFTADSKSVVYTRANNLYRVRLDTLAIEQLTDIRTGAPEAAAAGPRRGGPAAATGETPKGTDSQEFVKKEERELIDAVAQRAKLREEEEARRKRENPRKPFTLAARQSISSLALAPDAKTVIAMVAETAQAAKTTIVPNFVTESGYTEDIGSRDKVGDTQSPPRMALISVETGEVKWVDAGKEARLGRVVWSDDGTRAFVVARSADNKDRSILALDLTAAKTRVIASEHDDAWIGGPDSFAAPGYGWLKNGSDIYFLSERDGFSHVYTVSFEGGTPRQLTSGKWEVQSVRLSHDGATFYLTTNEPDPAEVRLWSMPSGGGDRTPITRAAGRHNAALSPDEKWIADVHSFVNRPPELFVMENRAGAEGRKLTESPAKAFSSYAWKEVPIVRFTARDGVEVPARLYKPADYQRGGPAVIFVHGAGYTQNVHRGWSSYSREYMFHHFLMEHGYLVLDVDYRGSAGYGRDWRTAIYRHMGGKDLDDQEDAARWLAAQHGVNPKRIGIYGGSYGGFITLMAMFTRPGVFAAGAALRPVTDWAHYNHGYTSNILNVPQKDAEAYRQSSPIYFASGLQGALLICHGMVDVNVHFQDTVRLVQKLIELKKTNWDLAVFPVEDHAFVQPTSWLDEYRRIFALFEKNLK